MRLMPVNLQEHMPSHDPHSATRMDGAQDPRGAQVGNTPLVELPRLARSAGAIVERGEGHAGEAGAAGAAGAANTPRFRVLAKLEQFNPGGSAKDRTAEALVTAALESGLIQDPTTTTPTTTTTPHPITLVESSSGNLGIALARQAHLRGWDFICVVDPRANPATITTIESYGATVDTVTEPDPDTGDWLTARRARVQELLQANPHAINLDQYSNQAAFTAHAEGTMAEIIRDLGKAPDWLFVAMSTTGTIGGCMQKLAEHQATPTTTVGVDAHGSVLFGGTRAQRLLPGFGAGIVPDLARHHQPDHVHRAHAADAVIGARTLARVEGLLPGASGGAVIDALLHHAPHIPDGADVVLILHDSGANYLDTIYNDHWVEQHLGLTSAALRGAVAQVVES